jgi:death-on-curing protein
LSEEIRFLTIEQILTIHTKVIERYGGDATLRDISLVESAVMLPQQSFGGKCLHPTPASMAAAYLFHLCSNHGFVDGNKRTAVGAALVFLDVNDFELALTIDELEQITLDVASGSLEKGRLTELLEAAIRPNSSPP